MLNLNLNLRPQTAKRFRKVLEAARDQEAFAENIIAYQVAELKRAIINLRVDIKAFEDEYKMTSDAFYRQYQQGKTDDRQDYMTWAGLYELLDKNGKELRELEG